MKEGWEYRKLEEVCNIDFGTRVVRSRDAGSIYPVYGGGGATFKMDTYNREDCMVISRFGMSEQCTRFVNGKFFLNDSGLTLSMKNNCMIQTFMDWQILYLNNTIYSLGRGAAQKNLDTKALAGVAIAYPINLSEQQSIVDYLDSAFAKIDAMKANAEKALNESKALFQSSLKEMLEPKEGWEEKTLGELATDMYRGSGIKRDQVTKEGTPCVRYGEIYTTYNVGFDSCVSHTKEEYISSPKYFEHGDLLFAITGESVEDIGKTIAYLGNEKCLCGGDIICMKHMQNPKFLAYALSTPDAIRQKGMGKTKLKVVHTNAPSLKAISIPVPTLAEQQSVVDSLDSLKSKVDRLQDNYEKISQECDALKQAILRQVFE